jgi:large subunit ribosomal protein L21
MLKKLLKYRTISILSALSACFVIGGFLWAYFALRTINTPVFILHFNDMAGITQVGSLGTLITTGVFGLLMVVINTFIALGFEERDPFFREGDRHRNAYLFRLAFYRLHRYTECQLKPMDFAIIKTGGKQYKVTAGQKLKVEKLDVKDGEHFSFDEVLLRSIGDKVEVGTPTLSGSKTQAKVLGAVRGEKKIIFKYHSKTRSRKKKGHRQDYTEVEIVTI